MQHRPNPVQTPDQQFIPQQQPPQMPGFQATPGVPAGAPAPPPQPPRPPSPKFISVDMPAAKISHSDVYMR